MVTLGGAWLTATSGPVGEVPGLRGQCPGRVSPPSGRLPACLCVRNLSDIHHPTFDIPPCFLLAVTPQSDKSSSYLGARRIFIHSTFQPFRPVRVGKLSSPPSSSSQATSTGPVSITPPPPIYLFRKGYCSCSPAVFEAQSWSSAFNVLLTLLRIIQGTLHQLIALLNYPSLVQRHFSRRATLIRALTFSF